MHAQYFALLNLILKLQFCGEACLEFPLNIPGLEKSLLSSGFEPWSWEEYLGVNDFEAIFTPKSQTQCIYVLRDQYYPWKTKNLVYLGKLGR